MDTFFNHDVADWISKSVSRMDDDEAEMFTLFTVYEVHKQDIENNRRTLDRHTAEVQASLLSDLHPEVRQMVAKALDPDMAYDAKWGKPQPRDGRGKFTRIVVERGKVSQPKRGVDYRQDKISTRLRQGQDFDLSGALSTSEAAGNAFSERWTARGQNDHSTNERTYNRVRAGAQLLGNVPNKNVQAAAALGDFAGKMGPEAEKIIGPTARRTAYRYRGTERMPDDALLDTNDQAMAGLLGRERKSTKDVTPEMRMTAGQVAAVNYLNGRLPSRRLADLHRESGKLPPSEGVIINREGNIVTQAIGFNEDHYLPFNLKNLKGLQGGAYVRTRSSGGLTTEDIYTGLVAGARSVTVVSRSGVFTLDFEDDLRGGRRYSDKARQMIGRYAQTLDAVQSEKVARRGLTPDERADIREEVEAEMADMGYTTNQIEAAIKTQERDFANNPKLTGAEVASIERRAVELAADNDMANIRGISGDRAGGRTEKLPDDPKKRILFFRSRLMDQAMDDKHARMYQLDSQGYEAAMDALKEQFPYYVANVKHTIIPQKDGFAPSSNEKDSGYVRPHYIRPQAVRAGYFDKDINGAEKFSAADLHYQNYGRSAAGSGADEEEGAAVNGAAPNKPRNLKEVQAHLHTEEQRAAAAKNVADAASEIAIGVANGEKAYPTLTAYANKDQPITAYSEADINKMMEEAHKLTSVLRNNQDAFPGAADALKEHLDTYKRKNAQLKSRVVFDESKWDPTRVDETPQKFKDAPEHTPGSPPEKYSVGLTRAVQRGGLQNEITAEMTDQQMATRQLVHGQLYDAAKRVKTERNGANDLALEKALMRAGRGLPGIERLFRELDQQDTSTLDVVIAEARKKALAIHEVRSIMAAAGDSFEPEAAATTAAKDTVPGKVISNKPAPKFDIQQVQNVLESDRTPDDVKSKLERFIKAWSTDDEGDIMAAVHDLPKEYGTMIQHVMEEMERRFGSD